jgi:hypothetical protein
MGAFISRALSSWLKSGKHLLAAARAMDELADGDYGIVQVEELESEEENAPQVFIAGAVFHSEEDAEAFVEAMITLSELAAEAE